MKKKLFILCLSFAVLSCDPNSDVIEPNSLIGFWNRETVYLNGVNSIEFVDFLNGGNYLEMKEDRTFSRAYDNGNWNQSNRTLSLERSVNSGMGDWTYKIIDVTKDVLTLEIKLTESQYCCGFDAFDENEIITILEIYKRQT
jgi:hypothetical protein